MGGNRGEVSSRARDRGVDVQKERGAVLDERDIVARIMRKENYLIGMVNRDVVNTRLEPVSILCKKDAWMTKSVQSNFDLAVFNWMFDGFREERFLRRRGVEETI